MPDIHADNAPLRTHRPLSVSPPPSFALQPAPCSLRQPPDRSSSSLLSLLSSRSRSRSPRPPFLFFSSASLSLSLFSLCSLVCHRLERLCSSSLAQPRRPPPPPPPARRRSAALPLRCSAAVARPRPLALFHALSAAVVPRLAPAAARPLVGRRQWSPMPAALSARRAPTPWPPWPPLHKTTRRPRRRRRQPTRPTPTTPSSPCPRTQIPPTRSRLLHTRPCPRWPRPPSPRPPRCLVSRSSRAPPPAAR